ncbi:MAG: DNA polymerase III subunit delta [Gemmatimonadales bacterium]
MAALSFDTFHRALKKGDLRPVYYFYGPEDTLKDEAIRALLDAALEPALRDFNLDQRSAPQLDPESLHALLNTLPMMADRRVVILRDVEGLKRKARVRAVLDAYLENPAADTLLVAVQGAGEEKTDAALSRYAAAVAFEPLEPERVLRWIAHRAGGLGLTFQPAAASHLLASVGNNLGALSAEIEKIASVERVGDVTVEQVAALVGIRFGETLADWRDLVMAGRAEKALPMTGRLLETPDVTAVRMITLLGTTLIGVGLARSHLDAGVRSGELPKTLMQSLVRVRPFGLGEWKVETRKWAGWAGSWPMARVDAALRAVLAADRALKSTRISDDRGLLADLAMRLAAPWRNAA